MEFSDIYGDVITARFKATQTTQIKRWINLREAQIWSAVEWPWKIVGPTSLSVTLSDSTPTLSADLDRPTAIYDDLGGRLTAMTQTEFDDEFLPALAQSYSGRPSAFKFSNGVLTLGPVPNQNYTFTMTYLRKLSHYATGAVVTTGPMTLDTDYPIFDEEWHTLLTIGAISTGLKLENDPTWESLEQEFGLMLSNMADRYLPAVAVAGNMQYGADWLR